MSCMWFSSRYIYMYPIKLITLKCIYTRALQIACSSSSTSNPPPFRPDCCTRGLLYYIIITSCHTSNPPPSRLLCEELPKNSESRSITCLRMSDERMCWAGCIPTLCSWLCKLETSAFKLYKWPWIVFCL